jgi:hypothetical protein
VAGKRRHSPLSLRSPVHLCFASRSGDPRWESRPQQQLPRRPNARWQRFFPLGTGVQSAEWRQRSAAPAAHETRVARRVDERSTCQHRLPSIHHCRLCPHLGPRSHLDRCTLSLLFSSKAYRKPEATVYGGGCSGSALVVVVRWMVLRWVVGKEKRKKCVQSTTQTHTHCHTHTSCTKTFTQ